MYFRLYDVLEDDRNEQFPGLREELGAGASGKQETSW